MMKCPVGHPGDIPDDALLCPICSTDLSSLQRVRQLHLAEYNEAVRLAQSGAVDLALNHALASLAVDDHFVPAITLVGKVLWKKGHFRDAMGRWQQAISLAPGDEEPKDLLAAGQAFLKMRRFQRILCVSAGALAIVVAGFLFQMKAGVRADRQTSALAVRISLLEKAMAKPELLAAAADHVASGRSSNLCPVSVVTPPPVAVSPRDVAELTDKIRAISDRQTEISAGMQSNAARLHAVAATVGEVQRELVEQASRVTASIVWARATVVGTVEALRPAQMIALAEKISQAESELKEIRNREESLRNAPDLMGALKHMNVKRRVRDCEARLRMLREEWQKDVLPWIRIKEKTDAYHGAGWEEPGG